MEPGWVSAPASPLPSARAAREGFGHKLRPSVPSLLREGRRGKHMGRGGCCTFHVQLSGTMERKNSSSVGSPPHPASLPLTGLAGTELSEGCDTGEDRPLLMPALTATLQIHHYSFIASFTHLFILQMFSERIHALGQPRLWAENCDQCLAFEKLPIWWVRRHGNRPALSAVWRCVPRAVQI